MTTVESFLIALGGNLPSEAGAPAETLRAALDALAGEGAELRAVSPFYATPCFPAGAGPDYVNAAAEIGFGGDARACLALLHRVEQMFGRERQRRWGRRTLDLDLIAQGAQVLPDREGYAAWRDLPGELQMTRAPDQLILPHPRLQERAFVLVPLADIAPDWRHPVLGLSVREMLARLPAGDVAEVVRLP
ncbi:2-amino-4-hydroxy-6-hydroxymethyldihydropteridine diphosphokinase [Pelagivirga sediminicola]|uniref:2-amino-4-hydroxy-6- hydroxymethyldihydropteridine diphosphokinase n=1 Tax=Pelagivirga sediminicola TaxID=2170575 RepID=UPI001FAFEDFB|nr:2-amino-4-hydroxy-6-hydroxymethyldihydropteridine diphosphokinase [Pelagivirga sediminicola]